MTPEQKQTELQRSRTILLATLDYLVEHLGGSFVYDKYDPVTEYYQQQKLQTEKYFKRRRLDRLKQRLVSLTEGLQNRDALAFTTYIKEKTGYDIDIFEDVRKRVAAIIAQNKIRSQKELNDISTMLISFHDTPEKAEEAEKLKSLLTDYSKLENDSRSKTKKEYPKVISRVKKEAIEEVRVSFSTGPKPKHFEQQWASSPDGKRKLRVALWGDGKQASTYVAIHFANGCSGVVYGMSGICPDVKARWKDNSTIVIETKKDYTANTQHKHVRSFEDAITIQYIEH